MICPHCERDVRHKERQGRRCKKCKKRFALEPKQTLLRTGDVRLRRVSDALSDGGALRYTPNQLFWRLARNRVVTPIPSAFIIAIGTLSAIVAGAVVTHWLWEALGVLALVGGLAVGSAAVFVAIKVAARRGRWLRRLPTSAHVLGVNGIVSGWREVYGEAPPGLATEEEVRLALQAPPPEDPVAIVACADRDVLGCLALNGVPALLGVALLHLGGADVSEGDVLGSDAPVLHLHDASAIGVNLFAATRARLGEQRTIDIGLTVAQVRNATGLPEQHGPPVEVDSRVRLDPSDREWLADGRSVALAAMSPASLITAVERAVADLTAADPERGRARLAGFM